MRALLSGLKGRLILTYLVIFLVSVAIMAGRAGSMFQSRALASAERDLEVQAFVMASAFGHPWTVRDGEDPNAITVPQLQSLTGRFAQGAGGQLNILDTAGNALAYSTSAAPQNQGSEPEVVAAAEGWLQHDVRYDAASHQSLIYAAAPIQRNGRIVGVVQLSIPLGIVTQQSQQFWLSLGLTALFAAMAAVLAAWWLATELVLPVGRLRDAAKRLADGNLDERVSAGGVTEMVQLADAFNNMAERVQDMINRQRAFVANASHELRTPLTNIKLRAEALNNGALEDPTVAHRFAGEIESEADRLGRMASDLLTLSRQDASGPARREVSDLGALASGLVDEMQLRAQKASVHLSADIEKDLPAIAIDAAGMRAVLINLLDNALRYTPPDGSIAVSICRGEVATRPSLMMSVTDTGEGIPPDDLPHVFERFYRADKARSRRIAQRTNGAAGGSGAGLGLAIVRGIIEEHGGTVAAQSELGHGTSITVTLPLAA